MPSNLKALKMNQKWLNVSVRHILIPVSILLCVGVFFFAFVCVLSEKHKNEIPKGGIFYVLHNNNGVYPTALTKFFSFRLHGSSIYISADDGYTYSFLDKTGSLQWRQKGKDFVYVHAPAFGNNHQVFITNLNGRVYAINDQSGTEIWRFTTPDLYMTDSEPIVTDHLVLFGSRNGKLYALNQQNGTLLWTFQVTTIDLSKAPGLQAIPDFSSIQTDYQRVYVNNLDGNILYALDKTNGRQLWSFTRNGSILQPPELLPNSLTVWTTNGTYYMLDKSTGKVMFSMQVPDLKYPREYLGETHEYIIDATNSVNSIDYSSGLTQWIYRAPNASISFMQEIGDAHVVIIGDTPDATLIILINTATGKPIWTKQFARDHICAILPNGDSFIVVGSTHQYSLGVNGSIHWYTDKNIDIGSAILSKNGVYLISQDVKPISITLLNTADGSLRWRYQSDHLMNAKSIQEYDGNIYLFSKDARTIIKLNGNYSGKLFHTADFKTISLNQSNWVDTIGQKIMNTLRHSNDIFAKKQNTLTLEAPKTSASLNDIYEFTIHQDESVYSNKYDDAHITGIFTNKSGKKFQIPAFYFDKDTWKLRFMPTSAGKWAWKIITEGHIVYQGFFDVVNSDKPSFLAISKSDPRLFTTTNGSIFIPIGIQNCVEDINQDGNPLDQWPLDMDTKPTVGSTSYATTSMDTYLSTYAQNGFNIFRWGSGNCSFTLWNSLSVSGNRYDLDQGAALDRLFSSLRSHGFHVWMSLFSFTFPIKDTLSTPQQQIILKHYLNYIVARYAGFVDVWELANEIRLDNKTINFMSSYIRSIDPYHHPITTNWETPNLSSIDINSVHWYSVECDTCHDLDLKTEMNDYLKAQKPVVFSEQGNMNTSWDYLSATRLRIRLWIGYFNKLFYIFWNTPNSLIINLQRQGELIGASNIYLGPVERQYVSVFSSFIANSGKQLNKLPLTSEDTTYAFIAENRILGYVYRQINYDKHKSTTIYLFVPADGTIQWIDTTTGSVLSEQPVQFGPQILTSPNFSIDIAFKIFPSEPKISK